MPQASRFNSILDALGHRSAQQIGAGVNAAVFRIDQTRVIKIHSHRVAYLSALKDFLDQLPCSDFRFNMPHIFECGEIDGQSYTIEQFIAGYPLREVFPSLTPDQKELCIHELFHALDRVHSIELPGVFGERLLEERGLTDTSWSGFLHGKCLQIFNQNVNTVRTDCSEITRVTELFLAEVALLPTTIKPSLVHGDLFFPNIMASLDGKITGIIDFSDLTIVGDPMIDYVSLALFAREEEGQTRINDLLYARFQDEFLDRKRLYGAYYALRFCGCKFSDPNTYAWCLEEFRRYVSAC